MSSVSWLAGVLDPPAGTRSSHAPEPSATRWLEINPPVSVSPKTTAPAPSPKRIHVPLSVQSVTLDIVSAPITSTFLYIPALIKLYPVVNA